MLGVLLIAVWHCDMQEYADQQTFITQLKTTLKSCKRYLQQSSSENQTSL